MVEAPHEDKLLNRDPALYKAFLPMFAGLARSERLDRSRWISPSQGLALCVQDRLFVCSCVLLCGVLIGGSLR